MAIEEQGDAAFTRGDLAKAMGYYEVIGDLYREKLREAPESSSLLRNLSVSLNKIGDVRRAQGDLTGALSIYEEGLAIRRDLAVVVDDKVTANEIVAAVSASAPALIQDVRIFDIYKGPGIEAGRKSVAIGLILQETSRTLTDEDADTAMAAAIAELKNKFAADLRD